MYPRKSQPQAGATVSQAARCAVGPVPVEQHRLAGRPRLLLTETGTGRLQLPAGGRGGQRCALGPGPAALRRGLDKALGDAAGAAGTRGSRHSPLEAAARPGKTRRRCWHAALAGDVEPLEMRGPLLCALRKDGIKRDFYFFYPFSVDFQLVVLSLLLRVKTKGGKKRRLLVSHLFTRLISPQGQRRVQGSPTDACTR